ncbi:hypothetical protein LOK49_LG07G01409 [Camellia lanceoleosa]|uniref:Uncharacterized protein n=1 Tax=Camellia lanceoleosa TaxID=1840588 RepID=A0ACC0GXV4_9ERIC|nr:hypothetical protein LOK49_LG07G01409 [Camellia lanceoleosa]
MAEGGEDGHGEGRRMAEGGDGTARRHHCDEEGGSFSASQAQSEASLSLDNHSIQGVYTAQGQARPNFPMGSNYVQGIYTALGQARPNFPMGSNYVEGVYTAQGQARPHFPMGSNYVEGHGRAIYMSQCQSQSRLESQSQPPFAMGRTCVHDVIYPTYDVLPSQVLTTGFARQKQTQTDPDRIQLGNLLNIETC